MPNFRIILGYRRLVGGNRACEKLITGGIAHPVAANFYRKQPVSMPYLHFLFKYPQLTFACFFNGFYVK